MIDRSLKVVPPVLFFFWQFILCDISFFFVLLCVSSTKQSSSDQFEKKIILRGYINLQCLIHNNIHQVHVELEINNQEQNVKMFTLLLLSPSEVKVTKHLENIHNTFKT